jgi:peptide/nickel transport system substrate-binding protein
MRKSLRTAVMLTVALVAAVALAACGSSSNSSGGSTGGSSTGATSTGGTSSGGAAKNGGTITIDAGTPPLSADQALDFTTQGNELYSVVNTPLLTFARGVQGDAGAKIIPGLAKSMPTVSDGGKTLTFQLRPGLKYSNGTPIKASDEIVGLERDIKVPWQAASFVSAYIQGGAAYAKGKAKTLSGVTADDKTGTITVHLVSAFAPMIDIFALAGTAPVPPDTPMKNLASTGTIGDGPYKWGPITPGHQYTLIKNTAFDVPGLARGHADKIVFNVNTNVLADAEEVLNNQADVFDPGDTLPASILSQVKSTAANRYQPVPTNSSWYFFFAVNQKPFNNLYARQAVLAALDERVLSRLDSGFQSPDCHLIPFGIPGHSSPSTCPFHNPTGPPNLALAKSLMKKSGMIGQPVTVWGEERVPRRAYVDYFTQVLNSLGFKATEKIVNSGVYFTTIGAPSTHPQAGFADWVQDFPNPWDFMQLFASNAGSSLNYGYVADKHYDSELNKLDKEPADAVASQWQALDQYAVQHAYYAVFGHEEFPKFYSNRLAFSTGVLSVEYQTDLTSLALK